VCFVYDDELKHTWTTASHSRVQTKYPNFRH